MEYLPTAVVFQMVRGKKPDNIYKMRHEEKSYTLELYQFTKADIAKIYRVEGTAALYVGSFVSKGKEFDLHAKSMSIDEIKKTLKDNPLVAVLGVEKGTDDLGNKKFRPVVSLCFNDMNDLPEIKREAIRRFKTHGKVIKDAQKTNLYKWEHKTYAKITGNFMEKPQKLSMLNKAAKKIMEHFDIPEDKVHISNAKGTKGKVLGECRAVRDDLAAEDPAFVILNIHDSTLETLIHEAAHMLVHFKFSRTEVQPHGAEYCGVLAHLCSLFYPSVSEDDVIESMKQHGLKVKKFITTKKKFVFSFK